MDGRSQGPSQQRRSQLQQVHMIGQRLWRCCRLQLIAPILKTTLLEKIMWARWKAEIRLFEKIHRCDLYFYAMDIEKGTLMPLNDIHRLC